MGLLQEERSLAFTLVVGLGNPGEEYKDTRHNAGFKVVDALAEELGARYWRDACGAQLASVSFMGEELILAKPQSFMNRSGGPVKRLCQLYECEPSDILIVHDELDVPEDSFRFKRDGGHGGHNGLRSIHEKLGTDGYARLRIGIGRPPGQMDSADYVLRRMKGEALESLEVTVRAAADAAAFALERGLDMAMQRYNGQESR